MRLKALHAFCLGGGRDIAADEVFEANGEAARVWINGGFAAEVPAEIPADDAPELAHTITETVPAAAAPQEMDDTNDASGQP